MANKYISVEDLQNFCDNNVAHVISPNDFHRMNNVTMPEYSAEEYMAALRTVAGMTAIEQVHYLGVENLIKSSMEGLYLVILDCDVKKTVQAAEKYRDEKYKASIHSQRMKVKKLADEIGTYNLKKFVDELIEGDL